MALRLRSEKGTDFVKGEAKACRGMTVFEPTHRAISLLDAPTSLLNGLITNDKFCLSRTSPSRICWTRRSPQRRVPLLSQVTFTMTPNIVEVTMKRQWYIQRQFQAAEDGERRWAGLPTLAPLKGY